MSHSNQFIDVEDVPLSVMTERTIKCNKIGIFYIYIEEEKRLVNQLIVFNNTFLLVYGRLYYIIFCFSFSCLKIHSVSSFLFR